MTVQKKKLEEECLVNFIQNYCLIFVLFNGKIVVLLCWFDTYGANLIGLFLVATTGALKTGLLYPRYDDL